MKICVLKISLILTRFASVLLRLVTSKRASNKSTKSSFLNLSCPYGLTAKRNAKFASIVNWRPNLGPGSQAAARKSLDIANLSVLGGNNILVYMSHSQHNQFAISRSSGRWNCLRGSLRFVVTGDLQLLGGAKVALTRLLHVPQEFTVHLQI